MKGPIAPRVAGLKPGDLGPYCRDCLGPVYLVKIENGPRIGVRMTFRHVQQHPPCQRVSGDELRVLVADAP